MSNTKSLSLEEMLIKYERHGITYAYLEEMIERLISDRARLLAEVEKFKAFSEWAAKEIASCDGRDPIPDYFKYLYRSSELKGDKGE